MLSLELKRVMDTPASRLQNLMKEAGMNQVELAEKTNKTKSLISSYLNPQNKISDVFLVALEDRLGWSGRWIRTGMGPKRIVVDNTIKTPHLNGAYSTDKPSIVIPEANEPEVRLVGLNDPDLYKQVRIVRYRVWASFVDSFDDFNFDEVSDTYPVYLPDLDGPITDKHMVFEVLGDSMEPTIRERSKVLAELVDDGNIEYLSSGVFIVAYRNQLVTKRIIDNNLLMDGTLMLHSDNANRGKITIRRDDVRYIWRVTDIVGSKVR